MEKRKKAATESGVLLLVIAAILVAVNALSALGGYKRVDTTKAERFTLSKGSGRLLQSMKGKLTVDAYVTKGLPKLDAFVRDLRDLLLEYKSSAPDKFEFNLIEAKDEDQRKAAKDAGLKEIPFGEASATEEKAAVTQGYMGIVFKYGAEKDVIPLLHPDQNQGLEFWITNKIRELRDKGDNVKHKVGVLSGHDEIKLTEANLVPSQMGKPNIQQVITQNFPFYSIVEVDLKGGDAEVDPELDGLIITQPGKELSEKELRRIDQFVMKGKSLAVVASAVNVKSGDGSMNASLNLHNLDKLLDGYGIHVNKDVVLDHGRSLTVAIPTQGRIAGVRLPQMPQVQDDPRLTGNDQLLDTSFAGFFRLPEVVMPFASTVELKPEKQPDIKPGDKFKIVARSSPNSVRETGDSVDLSPFRRFPQKGEKKQWGMAAYIEGNLKTAFPEGDKQGVDAPAAAAQPARVMLIASSQFLANPFARAGNGPDMGQFGMMMPVGGDERLLMIAGPYADMRSGASPLMYAILAFKNMLDWLSGDQDLLAVSAKILNEPGLVYGDLNKPKYDEESDEQLKKRDEENKAAMKNTQRWIEIVLILGIPILFSLYGVLRWRMRMNRRANVSLA